MSQDVTHLTPRKMFKRTRLLMVVVVAMLLSIAAFNLLSPTKVAHADPGCNWQGTFSSRWASSTGTYSSNLVVNVGQWTPYGDSASGYYNNGKVSGTINTYWDGLGGFSRFIGTWTRTSGNSGGPYQYGQFYLDLRANQFFGSCTFSGAWTYGQVNPIYGQPSWSWSGSKLY